MDFKALLPGLNFATKHGLTIREMETLILFMEQPLTNTEAAKLLEANPKTLHKVLQQLKLKGLLVLKDRDCNGNNLYEFDIKQIE